MKQVILTTVADDDGRGHTLMVSLFSHLCFYEKRHGEVTDGGSRCIVDCDEGTAFKSALFLENMVGGKYYDINKILIREVEI